MPLPYALRPLQHRNFRLWIAAQLVSLAGTWMQHTAQFWLMYRLTDSGLMLGLTGTLTLLPNLLLAFAGGAIADRFPRRGVLVAVKALAMLQATLLGLLALTGTVQPWHILALALFLGLVQALELPVRQAFVVELVPRALLPNAIGLVSSSFHVARFAGPAVAGVLIARLGEGPVILLNAASFTAPLLALWAMRLAARPAAAPGGHAGEGVFAGLAYARGHRPIRLTLVMIAAVSLLGSAATVLMPVFAAEVYGRGPETLGLLMGMLGAGSLLGALSLAWRREHGSQRRWVALAGLAVGAGLLGFSLSQVLWLGLVWLPLVGFAATTVFATGNAFIQVNVPDGLRGRVMALFAIALHGMVSLGQLALGALADLAGAPAAVSASALLLLVVSSLLALRLLRQPGGAAPEASRVG